TAPADGSDPASLTAWAPRRVRTTGGPSSGPRPTVPPRPCPSVPPRSRPTLPGTAAQPRSFPSWPPACARVRQINRSRWDTSTEGVGRISRRPNGTPQPNYYTAFGAEGRNRTGDTMIFSHVLYRL